MAAASDFNVLITGETGTGKELIAHRIHEKSSRAGEQYVIVDCGAMVEGLVESELFGHAKGAFTGAMERQEGKMRLADGGTLVLDEVGEVPLLTQPKLLRALQNQKFSPVGEAESVQVNVRIVASTNVDLEQKVEEKCFRADLFYRLNVIRINVPPLRERQEDIPLLVGYFVQKYAARNRVIDVTPEAMKALVSYSWPGNIRQLQNVIQRAVALSRGVISVEQLDASVTRPKPQPMPGKNRAQRASREAQREMLLARLAVNGNNRTEAAEWMGITRQWVRKLLREE